MGPKRNKKKVKLSKAQKAKLKKQAAELKAQQEEEARLQREKEERERKEREAKEREERQILEEQERARHQDKIDEFNQLLEENKKIWLDFKRSKLKKQKWEKYMLCDGRPNISSYKEMNMFISLLADDDDDVLNFKHVLEKCDLIVELVKECDKSAEDILLENSIVEEAGETTGLMSLQKYNEIKDALQILIGLRIDVATKKNLEQPINAIDIETLNITIEDQSQHFKICLWGNTGKNPRVKQITFQNDKFTMELPKVMALSDVALRIIYLDLDIFSSKCCTFAKKLVLENKEGNPEVEKNTEGFCTKNTGNGAVDGEFTIVGNNGREKQSELSEDFQKNKVIKTEIEKENLLETIIDLRQYRPLGRIFIVNLLELPPQEKEIKGWVMQQVISGKLKKFTYNKDENSNLSPSLTSIKMAYNSPLNLTISIDENVILHDTPQIAWWDSLTKHWTNEGISDVCYKKEENLLYFRTATLGPFAVMQEIYFNMPFQTWSVCPLALNMCVLKVVGAAIEVLITVKDDLCCASFPKDKQLLPHLNNHWVSSKELIEESYYLIPFQ